MESPVVSTRQGRLEGRWVGNVRVFKGVPYAKPPSGVLRFRPPIEPPSWQGVRDCGTFGHSPVQSPTPIIGSVGPVSEDCLNLNIWAPADAGPHPVLFWVYGGANIVGAASQPLYDGRAFAAKGLVFVSANYRLGAFGFLELGSLLPALSGSGLNGLRDLVAALGWVRDNIAAFSGDPAQIAIMGESAGGKNVCGLMAIPAAQGLFRRAAVQSGGGHTVFDPAEAAEVARAFVKAIQPSPSQPADVLTLPAEQLLAAQNVVMKTYEKGFPFRPTIDGQFLPRRPIDALRDGCARDVSLVIGTCRDEGALFLPGAMADSDLQQRQLANLGIVEMQEVEARYLASYPDLSASARRIRALTAEEYWMPSVEFAQAHSRSGGLTRMYRFDCEVHTGPLQGFVPHGFDVQFIFNGAPIAALPEADPLLKHRIHAMWADWALTDNATLEGAAAWPAYETAERQTRILGASDGLARDPNGAERQLWNGVL